MVRQYYNNKTLAFCQFHFIATTYCPILFGVTSAKLWPSIIETMTKVRKIHQLALTDRPREKLKKKGASALSDFELLEAVLGMGNGGGSVGSIALQVQRLLHHGLEGVTYEALIGIKGVSHATAARLLAAIELAKRQLVWDGEPLHTMQNILARLSDLRVKQQEYVVCLSLDGAQRLIAQRTISIGTLDAVIAHPREVYADAIGDRAASIIVAHNHPSGDVLPSKKDITLTNTLYSAGRMLGVPLRDHIIVAKGEHFSFAQHHLIY
jgi:DNA repair protein RadC